MNTTKLVTDIGNWLVMSGFLGAFCVFLWKYFKPLLEQKRLHAKTMQERELLGVIEALADNAVTMMIGKDMTGEQKFDSAVKAVNAALKSKNLSASNLAVEQAVQTAYEKSPLTTPAMVDSAVTKDMSATKISSGKINLDANSVEFAGKSFIPSNGTPTPAPAPTPAGDPVMDAIAKAPNRANDVKEG